LGELIEWIAEPKKFKEKVHGEADNLSDEVIRHQAYVMLKMFLFYRNVDATGELASKIPDRELLEGYLVDALEIKNIRNVKVSFRLLKVVEEDGKPVEAGALKYDVIFEKIGEHRHIFPDAVVDQCMNSPEENYLEYKGRKYRMYPIECVNFKEVEMTVPGFEYDAKIGKPIERKKIVRAFIYSGDGRLIHSKDVNSIISSLLRGKTISDQNRWALVFQSEEDKQAFSNFIYGMSAFSAVKVEDLDENRKISKKGQNLLVSSATTPVFKQQQLFAAAVDVVMAEKTIHGLNQKTARLETQVSTLAGKLIGDVSKFSKSSHKRYRAVRAWETMWRFVFPATIYGREYWKLMKQGYDYGFIEQEKKSSES
jgi:hypothetical protein